MLSAAIIPSNRPDDLDDCLKSIDRQSKPIDKIIVVAWGKKTEEKDKIRKVCDKHDNNIIITHTELNANSIADSRNAGIFKLKNDPPHFVIFLDDDMILKEDWHEFMGVTSNSTNGYQMQSTVTLWRKNRNVIQSCGHYFDNFSPLDLGYNTEERLKYQLRDPLFPCANGAYIAWTIIENILKIESQVWDNNFGRMTCFDFGLKALLLGYKCALIRDSIGYHKGYLDKNSSLSEKHIENELKARLLLYWKFLPIELREIALKKLENKVTQKWWIDGYPHARDINGEKLLSIYDRAKNSVAIIKDGYNNYWIEIVDKMPCMEKNLIFYLTMKDRCN